MHRAPSVVAIQLRAGGNRHFHRMHRGNVPSARSSHDLAIQHHTARPGSGRPVESQVLSSHDQRTAHRQRFSPRFKFIQEYAKSGPYQSPTDAIFSHRHRRSGHFAIPGLSPSGDRNRRRLCAAPQHRRQSQNLNSRSRRCCPARF